MTLGQKLKNLRNEKRLTQKDLADQLHVSFQTISKWESDINEPDIATLKELARFYGCSLDYLLNNTNDAPKKDDSDTEENKPTEIVTKTIIVHEKEKHICARCGKEIPDNELTYEDVTKKEKHGRGASRIVNLGRKYYHKKCLAEINKERNEKIQREKDALAASSKKKCFGWGIFAGVTSLIIALLTFFLGSYDIYSVMKVVYSVLIGYGMFAMIYCIVCGSYIGDVFIWCATRSVKFPGIIFSWDLDGFAFLIAMKVLFAIIGFLIGIATFFFAVIFSFLLGGISFPFILVHNIRTNYEDTF